MERKPARRGVEAYRSRGTCLPVHSVLDVGGRAKLVCEHLGDARHLANGRDGACERRSKVVRLSVLVAPRGERVRARLRRAAGATPHLVAWMHDERDHGRAVAARRLKAADQLRYSTRRAPVSAGADRNGGFRGGKPHERKAATRAARSQRRRARLIFHISMLFSAPASSAMVLRRRARAPGRRG